MTDEYDIRQSSYNKITSFPLISYNLISYLMDNDEYIWRLLYYDSADAWNENECVNLTKKQKGELIYNGKGQEVDYRIFFDVGDDSWTKQANLLRIFPMESIPHNYVYGHTSICFQVYSHAKNYMLTNYTTRNDSIIQRLIEVFNGADIPNIGRIFFDLKVSTRCRIYTIGQPPMKGKALIMATNVLG